jgi:hypothetical protein
MIRRRRRASPGEIDLSFLAPRKAAKSAIPAPKNASLTFQRRLAKEECATRGPALPMRRDKAVEMVSLAAGRTNEIRGGQR